MPVLAAATAYKRFQVLTQTPKVVPERVVTAGLKPGPPSRIKIQHAERGIRGFIEQRVRAHSMGGVID